jgi:lysophospholipase L1-like esterase
MVHFSKKYFLYIIFVLVFASCGGGGSGNGVTVSGGDATAAASQQKIVFSGDSTISRGNWSSYFGFPIENDGVSGLESWQLVNTIEGYVASKPNKIVIAIGGNNILNRHEGVLVGDICTIIDKIRTVSPATRIFILSILPVKDNFSCTLIESYNNQIYSYCSVKNVKFISVYGLFKSSSTIINLKYYLGDGVHLNDAGYQVYVDAIRSDVLS